MLTELMDKKDKVMEYFKKEGILHRVGLEGEGLVLILVKGISPLEEKNKKEIGKICGKLTLKEVSSK